MRARCLLLVDSDPAVHESLHDLLHRDDRTIQDAYDGNEALSRLKSAHFDLVVAGNGTNGFDGLKLLRRVRAMRPDAKVIVTGELDRKRVVGAIRNRAYSYFHKPLPDTPLSEMVQMALDDSSWKDDIRVLSARPEWITLEIRCKLDAADRTTHFLREIEADLASQVREDIASAFRELLMNAIEHGGKSDPRKRVRVSLIRTARSVIVHIHDPGTGFSLDFLPHAAISNPADSPTKHVEVRAEQGQRPGGFGILMTRQMADELIYNERGNAVLFIKYLK
ncbi:MAG TPA: ATP-binding protein [Bryobacteraceae bacterium]|nr:ATP-binding protein [Bryobacteraceae bacterium]